MVRKPAANLVLPTMDAGVVNGEPPLRWQVTMSTSRNAYPAPPVPTRARINFDGERKRTFAKKSANSGHPDDVNEKERPPCGGLSKAVRDVRYAALDF